MEQTTILKTFNYQEDGSVNFSMLSTTETTNKLKNGVYNLHTEHSFQSGYTTKLSCLLNQETYKTEIPFFFKEKIDKVFEAFYDTEVKNKVNTLGYKHKVGLLLHGKQGTGKTSLIRDYFNNTVSCCGSVVFNITNVAHFQKTWEFIQNIRKIQDNSIVVFIDECDSLFENSMNQENTIKKILDGIDAIDNCMVLMATNYLDKIPETIRNRPSRIKYIIEVEGIQDLNIVENFLKQSFDKIQMTYNYEKDLDSLKGKTMDELKEYILNAIMSIEDKNMPVKTIGFKK